jgi:hypothetical protein
VFFYALPFIYFFRFGGFFFSSTFFKDWCLVACHVFFKVKIVPLMTLLRFGASYMNIILLVLCVLEDSFVSWVWFYCLLQSVCRDLCFCLDERFKFYMDYGKPIWCLLVCGSWIGWSASYKCFFVICGCLLVKPWRVGLGLCYLKLKVVTCLWFSSGSLLLFTAQQNPSLYFGAAIYLWYQRLLVLGLLAWLLIVFYI